ncbi:NADH-quinone oxidoreductase subunit C [Streptomyces sp. NPDC021212]|uniref:NADH-quinone oxidoreductase subunit C n=1 Tax=Streptomyces sp. NPDC021212 TaxID=3365118 RepID=UPI003796CC8C
MTEPVGWLPSSPTALFGEGATAEEAYGLLTVDVPADAWITALETARDTLGCTYFDWLSAVDEPGTGFRVAAHVAALAPGAAIRRLLVRTTVPHDAATLPTAVGVYAGAAWHERETHEMFGVGFSGHPGLAPLLLPDNFEGHPLRKDFVLAARVAKAWPGAKEPGESDHGGPKRRQMLPPGVPDPNEWGPLKGQLPPAPARPARGARAAGDRPTRRTRTAAAGSATQSGEAAEPKPTGAAPAERRARSASAGSASQRAAAETTADVEPTSAERPARRAGEGSTGQQASAAADAALTETEAQPAAPAESPAGEDSAGQQAAEAAEPAATPDYPAAERPARRTRSASAGSANQQASAAEPTPSEQAPAPEGDGATSGDAHSGTHASGSTPAERPARRARSASDGSASQQASADAQSGATTPDASAPETERPTRRPRSSDAPWHHARPAYGDDTVQSGPAPEAPADDGQSGTPQQDAPERPEADQRGTEKPDETTHPDGPPGGTA